MKTIIKTTLNTLLISIFTLMTISMTSQEKTKNTDSFTVQVDGLGCPFCAYGLEKKFKELKGMKNPKIEIETGVFTFDYPSEKRLNIEQVNKQVEKAGYTPIQVEISRANGEVERSENQTSQKELNKGEVVQISFRVEGNCGMCKARIEKAAKSLNGVSEANWNEDSKMLTVKVDEGTSSQKEIEQSIAKVGHATESEKANDSVYENLPPCCLYKK